MLPYVLFGGVKKLGQLFLVHPYHSIFGIQGDKSFAIFRVVNDNILLVIIHVQSSLYSVLSIQLPNASVNNRQYVL